VVVGPRGRPSSLGGLPVDIAVFPRIFGSPVLESKLGTKSRRSHEPEAAAGENMPVISMFYGIIVSLYFMDNRRH
jgi:hypothetical protein